MGAEFTRKEYVNARPGGKLGVAAVEGMDRLPLWEWWCAVSSLLGVPSARTDTTGRLVSDGLSLDGGRGVSSLASIALAAATFAGEALSPAGASFIPAADRKDA